ncbi:MAG: aconitase X, partial [Methyloceanibacter sp.]
MKRRDVLKGVALMPLSGALLSDGSVGLKPGAANAQEAKRAGGSVVSTSAGKSLNGEVPDFAEHIITSDMDGLGPDGKPTGQKATFSGASKADATADNASSKMKLTKEEQDILDGKDGEEKAKLMKILVMFGETFGATKLTDLGGAPHSNLYIGAPYLESLIV